MKKTLHLSLMFLFVLSLGACTSGKQSAIEVKDPTSKTRFAVSSDGVTSDAGTGLEWVTGPNVDCAYSTAELWLTSCKVAGGVWRMPTLDELETLYLPGVTQNNMAPAFKTTGWLVWAESPSSAYCLFDFSAGSVIRSGIRDPSWIGRVFGVRSRPR
jgi:hypothetical protein